MKNNFSHEIVLEFTEIMSSLLKSGLTIQETIALCSTIVTDPKTAWLCKSLLSSLQNGMPLHGALKIHSSSFSSLYISLVGLGEQTGSVAMVFERMGTYLRNDKKIRGKMGSVIWYPLLVLCIAFLGSIGIIVFILPRMAEIFMAFNAGANDGEIPELINVYRSMWIAFTIIALIILVVIISILLRKRSERFAYLLDYFILNMPIFGKFVKAIHTMDFSFAMEMLTGSGINVHLALRETAAVVRNRVYSKALNEVYSLLLKGEILSQAFVQFKEFPVYIATWIAVGERTGSVEPVFTQIRSFFQDDVDRMSERLMNLLEPGLILVVGIIVIVIVLQFVLPLFSLYGRLL